MKEKISVCFSAIIWLIGCGAKMDKEYEND